MRAKPRILLVNGNSSPSVTDRLAGLARAAAPQMEFRAYTPEGGPAYVSTPADVELATGRVVETIAAAAAEDEPDACLIACFGEPGMIEARGENAADESLESEALAAAEEAIGELDEFRVREGAAIEAEIRMRAGLLRDLVSGMEEIRGRALPQFHQRLRDKLSELLGSAQIDPARLAQETAMLAERSDISEELVRLKTHVDQTCALISAEGETGKKLDFLLQEMNREANTILSKTGGLGETGLVLTDLGLAAKAEIDRIREQSLNIE